MLSYISRLYCRYKFAKILKPMLSSDLPATKQIDNNTRLNQSGNYLIPNQFCKKYKPKYLVGRIFRIEQVLAHQDQYLNQTLMVAGWVKSARLQGNQKFLFVELSDGTSSIQIVIFDTVPNWQELKLIKTAYSLRVSGTVIKSQGKNQLIEISVSGKQNEYAKILGKCDNEKYPLASKFHKPQTLREHAHLRIRTNLISTIAKVKNNLAYSTHQFFQNNGFYYVKTPIITTADCEGAGEMFQVTTILPQSGSITEIPKTDTSKIDYTKQFFKKQANLTVSGQLTVQTYCCALSNVYTFGPTFRAQQSHTTRHLAEFWMIEPQMAFADIHDVMECAEAYIKFCVQYVLDHNYEDLKWLDAKVKKGHIQYLEKIVKQPFAVISYSEAIEILKKAVDTKCVEFESKVQWGIDLASQHEKYLCDHIYHRPTIVYNYPKNIKSFYMRLNADNKTVASFDVLVPQIGQLVGGSQRQERLEILENKMKQLGLKCEDYWWYLDLRRYGTVPHAGFGLGFERLVLMCTGVENVRDVVPFPRVPGNAQF